MIFTVKVPGTPCIIPGKGLLLPWIMQYGTGPTTAVQVDYGLLVHSQICTW